MTVHHIDMQLIDIRSDRVDFLAEPGKIGGENRGGYEIAHGWQHRPLDVPRAVIQGCGQYGPLPDSSLR